MDQILDIDLDYFNFHKSPVRSLRRILKKIDRKLPVYLELEHHKILPHLIKLVKENKINKPYTLYHVDTHHDLYKNKGWNIPGGRVDCGNFLYHIPTGDCKNIIWIKPNSAYYNYSDILQMNNSLKNKHIHFDVKSKHVWSFDKLKAIFFTISPDYISHKLKQNIEKLINLIVQYFKLDYMFVCTKKNLFVVKNWEKIYINRFKKRNLISIPASNKERKVCV